MAKRNFWLIILLFFSLRTAAQNNQINTPSAFALEARVTTYLQGGYDLGAYYYPKNSMFSFGFLIAGHDIRGNTKELIFNSSHHDALDLRLMWLMAIHARYHFNKQRTGFFLDISTGMEEFRVRAGNEVHYNNNGFITPGIGYIWYPWQRANFYLLPKISGAFIIHREEERIINGTSYQLKSFFPSPSIAIGWKF